MSSEYVFRPLDDAGTERELSRFDSDSPYCTLAYARSLRAMGNEVWVFAHQRDGQFEDATLGCVRRSRWSGSLQFPSLAACAGDPAFWEAVYTMARRNGLMDIAANSFCSPEFELPPLQGETYRRRRQEFVVDLQAPELRKFARDDFRANVRKGDKAGLELRRGRDPEMLEAHLAVMQASRHRREERGEEIMESGEADEARIYLAEGAAELFQVVKDGEVLSSRCLLRSAKRASTQTSGSQRKGMTMGAAHFLIFRAAEVLKSEGVETLVCGGAPEGSTLAEFKRGFCSRIVTLPAATCCVGPLWKRKARTLVGLLRHRPQELQKMVTGARTRWLVYGLDLSVNQDPIVVPGAEFQVLTEDRLMKLKNPPGYPDFRQKQVDRMRRMGGSPAYGVYVDGALAHIRWFVDAEHSVKETPRILLLEPDEGEITASETFPEFRGRGLSPFAIQQVAALARQRGMRRIYGKTTENNIASQRSMTKAGFKPIGHVDVIQPPLRPGTRIVKRSVQWS